jgi:putative transposase
MAPGLFAAAYAACERLQHIWADMASRGQRLHAWVAGACGWALEIVKPSPRRVLVADDVEPTPRPPFTVLPRRWVVEHTIAWMGRYRLLSKEYEDLPKSSETLIYLAMSRLMLRRHVR